MGCFGKMICIKVVLFLMEEKRIPKKLDKTKENYQIPSPGAWGDVGGQGQGVLHQKGSRFLSLEELVLLCLGLVSAHRWWKLQMPVRTYRPLQVTTAEAGFLFARFWFLTILCGL